MNTEVQLGVVALLSSIATGGSQWAIARLKAKTETVAQEAAQEQLDINKHASFREDMEDLVDQLQEERKQDRSALASLRDRVARLESHDRIKDDYINQLRQDITDGRPPPPRDWPVELRKP